MRNRIGARAGLLLGTCLSGAMMLAAPAAAQSTAPEPASVATGSAEAAQSDGQGTDIVVTGSRIRRAATDTVAPVVVIDQQSLTDRGYTTAAQALNNSSSIVPALNQAPGNGNSAGSGQQFPNLFGLGTGRTLTLLNGRRMVTTSSGLGDAQVDANIMPTGLLDRVEVVQAGGAVVYGSDAIAGVANYVLKKNFHGVELDLQGGEASEHRYGTFSTRLTAGLNFGEGKGNVALNVEHSESPALRFADRRLSNLARVTVSNPNDTGPNDGISSVREVLDARFWEFNTNGVVFNIPAPLATSLTRVNGAPVQFAPDGSLLSYNPGTILATPFAQGGEGFRYSDLAGLRTGVKRTAANLIGHYDLASGVTLSGEFLYARTIGDETPQGTSRTILNNAASGAGPISFTRANPYLTPATVAALSAASPAFNAGGPLFLSKIFYDLVPDNRIRNLTETYRGVVSLDGEFKALGDRDFYWSASVAYARVDGTNAGYGVVNSRFANAIASARNAAGQIVCAINADASATNDDPACAPINPFGDGNVGALARAYVSAPTGQDYTNKQADALLTLGGDIASLPGGTAKFSVAYEHRDERVDFRPYEANRLGQVGTGAKVFAQSGGYNTDEVSGEVLIPIVGGDFTLPLVHSLELNGALRRVANSIAGRENLWSAGLRWEVVPGLTLRGSRSRNFRAPTLTQLFAPSVTALATISVDPCDADRINAGPNPTQRRASCLALFTANPLYGTGGTGSAAAGSSAEVRLAAFQDPSENFARASVTTGGNAALRNEISRTSTYGVVFQPSFVPGLTMIADRIEVDLQDGLSAFTTQNFAEACYDNANPDPAVCNAFTRLAAGDGTNPAGSIATGRITTFNAGVVRFRGEVYNINYRVRLNSLVGGGDIGTLELGAEATHTSRLETSVTGATFTRTDNTVAQPDWVGKFNLRYALGGFRFTYQLTYLDKVLSVPNATIENTPTPVIGSNVTHDVSAQYDFGTFTIRSGVTNLTNREPSYPSLSYGDIIGRQFYVGLKVKL